MNWLSQMFFNWVKGLFCNHTAAAYEQYRWIGSTHEVECHCLKCGKRFIAPYGRVDWRPK